MATTFLEPGGDATFNVANTINGGFWSFTSGAAIATDFVHGGHIKSIKYRAGGAGDIVRATGSADSGTRISFYIYIVAYPTSATLGYFLQTSLAGSGKNKLRITSTGVLQLLNNSDSQIGSNGATLSTGTWYRISLAYMITSSSVNEFRVFVDGVSSISVTNATSVGTGATAIDIGNLNGEATLDSRSSDHYIDDSSSLTDTGDVWVTAKRPNANGTANNFSTQIGSGGSGYGTGHSPQVNERALSTTNGWSMIGAGSAVTEEYNIESVSTGDIDLTGATIIDYMGWVYASAALSETGNIIVNNVSTNISLTSTNTMFTKAAGSTTYPAGSGTDIGIVTSTTVTTVSLYETGIMIAFIPASPVTTGNDLLLETGFDLLQESGSRILLESATSSNPTPFTNTKLKTLNIMGIGS